jgi:fructokinase
VQQLDRLLDVKGPVRFVDVNLRPPFADPPLAIELAKRADVLKLNAAEAGQLAAWVSTGEAKRDTPRDEEAIARACEALARAANVARICVTRAEEGAAFWDNGQLTSVPAPHITVKDTVGAGDAFMAGLVAGLTKGAATRKVLEDAARLGAFVASRHGATPFLPPEITRPIFAA